MGTGLMVIWFVAALIYIFLKEKHRPKRILFLYVPLVMMLLYFNLLFSKLFFQSVGSEIYYRMWWMIPVLIVNAYSAVCICEKFKGRRRGMSVAVALLLIIFSGKAVYDSPTFGVAENGYHVPQSVVEICDAIVVPGREVMAAFPVEFLFYVRQYDARVCMPYGRIQLDGFHETFLSAMMEEEIDLSVVAGCANETLCHYVVIHEGKKLLGDPRKFGWEEFDRIRGYVIYRNMNIPLEIPQIN